MNKNAIFFHPWTFDRSPCHSTRTCRWNSFSSNCSVFPDLESLIQTLRTESGPPSSSLMKVKLTKENKDLGSLMRKREKKDLQVFTQKPISGLRAPRVHTLSADCTADRSRKVNRRAMERKANVQDPASVRGQKEKVLQRGTTTSKTQLSGEKGKGKKGKKGMKGKDSGRAKEKATVKTKEENNFNNNLHKQMSLNKHHLALHKPPSKILRIFSGFRVLKIGMPQHYELQVWPRYVLVPPLWIRILPWLPISRRGMWPPHLQLFIRNRRAVFAW